MSKAVSMGVEDFKKIIDNNYYFVDKTLFIKNVIDNADDVCLITRPRRFGKTLNLSILKYYFDIRLDSKELFKGLKIMDAGERYTSEMNKYPVIFLTLKDIKNPTYEESMEKFKGIISELYINNSFLLEFDGLFDSEKRHIQRMIDGEASSVDLQDSLKKLSNYLYRYYGVKVLMLIDEYDVPLKEAYTNGFYNKAIFFWKNFFSTSFKTNNYLSKTILTGVSRVSKEGIYSDFNNSIVHSVIRDPNFSEDFGFTEEEVLETLKEYDMLEHQEDVKTWYDGYKIGTTEGLYNPWSILNYINQKELVAYWVNTGGEDLIKLILRNNMDVKEILFTLLNDESIIVNYDENTTLNNIEENIDNVWGLFVSTGYLKVVEKIDDEMIRVAIPNLEVKKLFARIITDWFKNVVKYETINTIANSLVTLNYNKFISNFKTLVSESFSFFDVGNNVSENFYYAFVLGLLVSLKDSYYITSNRESGKGRYDILMKPKDKSMPSFILEFKVVNNDNFKNIIDGAKNQVMTQEYDTILRQEGYENIQKLVFAFQGKDVQIEVF